LHVVAAGLWDLALSALDRWARVDRADRAVQEGRGVLADLVVPAGRAVQEAPGARAVQLGRARRAPEGRVVRDALVRVVDDLGGKRGVSRPFGGLKPEAGSPLGLVGALGNVRRSASPAHHATRRCPCASGRKYKHCHGSKESPWG